MLSVCDYSFWGILVSDEQYYLLSCILSREASEKVVRIHRYLGDGIISDLISKCSICHAIEKMVEVSAVSIAAKTTLEISHSFLELSVLK